MSKSRNVEAEELRIRGAVIAALSSLTIAELRNLIASLEERLLLENIGP